MKKGLVLLLCLLSIFSVFASGTKDEQISEISHWTWSNGALYQAAWDVFIRENPEYSNVEYNFTSLGGSSQAMMQQIMLSYAAGAEVPDVIEMNFKLNPMLIESGVAADITEIMAPYKDKVPEFVWDSAMHDGRMYGIPLRGNSSMMLYRADLCEEAGIDMTAIKTWDDFFEAGKKFREYYLAKGEDIYWTTISADKPADYWGEILFGQQGIGFFDENGECIVDTDPRAIEAIKTIYRIHSEGFSTKLTDLTPSWYGALAEGKVGCVLSAGWLPSIMLNNVPDGAGLWRIAPYPTFSNGKQSMQGTMGYTILTTDKEKQKLVADVLLKTVFDDELCYELEDKTLTNFSLNIFEEKPPVSENTEKLNQYFGGQNVKQIDMEILSNALLHQYTPDFTEVLNIMNVEIAKTISGQKTIDQAISDMGSTIRQQIGTSKF